MRAAQDFLRQAKALAQKNDWQPPKVNELILRAVALGLRQHPTLNASVSDESIALHKAINVGMVIGVDDGMLIPVIYATDEKNLFTLAAHTQRLKKRAQLGTLSQQDLSGGTFTVSNLGMYGLDSFTAIINPPEVGILAVGALRDGHMTLTLSSDHRAVDGVQAARFMATLRQFLENPLSLAIDAPEQL
jgi:pyruvate dehydrogenase E2 component (dihydrolipoamide acetyltransferase)